MYLRVSTKKQASPNSHSLDAQRYVILKYLDYKYGIDYKITKEIIEVSSATQGFESQDKLYKLFMLQENLNIVVSDPDRLTRNRSFAEAILNKFNVETANLHIDSKESFLQDISFSEREAAKISMRTKRAIADAKRKGTKVGANSEKYYRDPNTYKTTQQTKAHNKYLKYKDIVDKLMKNNKTPTQMTIYFNTKEILPPNGCMWTPAQIIRMLKYLGYTEYKGKRT